KQVFGVELGPEVLARSQTFIQAKLDRLDEYLKALRIILDVQALNVVRGRHRTEADLVRRYVIGRANDLTGPLQLFDQLRIRRFRPHGLVFETVAKDRYLAGVLPGEVGVPIFLEAL